MTASKGGGSGTPLGDDAPEYCQRTTTNGCVDGGDRASDNDKVEEDNDGSGVEGHC